MNDERLKQCLIKLVQNLRDNKLNSRKKVTLFMGAGCSLSSSKKDITTYGIIRNIVIEYSNGEPVPKEWYKLYELFTNNVWAGQGDADKINLLERYFRDMLPSVGYQYVRSLIEEDYINNIITTNFDPMIDNVLEGLSYNLMVGTQEETIGENPQFTVLKPHGDLKRGQLRFSPGELYKLPAKIEDRIRTITEGIVIIVGYRGQDMGIIQALNESENHCAYWITYDKPDSYNTYENEPIFNWLKKRSSENNLLYGPEFGDFDVIFDKAVKMLQQQNVKKQSDFYMLWQKSYLNDYFLLNSRFQKIFIEMLIILENIVSKDSWNVCSLYYAESHNILAEAVITLLNEKTIPVETLYCISNELDSLLFAISIEIWCLCQGYPVLNTNLIDVLQKEYLSNQSNPVINEEFWNATKWLSSLVITERPFFDKSYCEIVVSLDKEKDFQVILKRVSLLEFSSLFLTIQRLLLFVKTSDETVAMLGRQYKGALEQHLYQIQAHEKQVDIRLNSMAESLYQEIYNNLLKNCFSEKIVGSRHILHFCNIYVNIDVEPRNETARLSIIDELLALSEKMTSNFLEGENTDRLLKSNACDMIQTFLASKSNGLFLLGESGIGKSCVLKKIISDSELFEGIILPVAAKQTNSNFDFIKGTFGKEIGRLDQVEYIDKMLEQRGQILLLIVDAINEINAPLQQIISIYKNLLEYCDFLSQKGLNNIKIIITCRTEFYYQIQYNIPLQPSPSSFFTKINSHGEGSTLCTLSGFQKEDVTAFISNYALNGTVDADTLFSKFGSIIYVPLYLDMICKINAGEILDENLPNEFALYLAWFHNIINVAKAESISVEYINNILSTIIYSKYFCTSTIQLTTSQLFVSASASSEDISSTYEWLLSCGVLKSVEKHGNTVFFAHDKIEEFLLIQYIYNEYDCNLEHISESLNPEQQKSPILQNSICTLLQILSIKNKEKLRNYLVFIINSGNNWLTSILVEILLGSSANYFGDLYVLLKCLEEFVCKATFENFINDIYTKINEKIDSVQHFDGHKMDCMNEYINNSTMGTLPSFIAMNAYSYARYIWIFPVWREDRDYTFAIQLCQKVNKLDANALPARLIDKTNRLLAILLRNQGKLNEAAKLMESVYQNLSDNVCFDEACQALLELGAIYRELTLFDRALALYQSYDISLLHNISLKYRIYMNTGIIYKNKAQNALFQRRITNDIYEHYYKSKELFDEVYAYTQKVNDIPFQLEILAELIESTVVGYYLDLTTISAAKNFAEEMDSILPKYPVPVRKIQKFRMWARILTLSGKALEAIECLRQGFEIAIHYNIPFRAADCCNQISGILCDNLNSNFITPALLEEGIKACRYSINYYMQLQQSEHVYLKDSQQKLEKLQKALNNIT